MNDGFSNYPSQLESPPRRAFAITPNDAADLAECPRAITVNTDGIVRYTLIDMNDGTYVEVFVAGGAPYPGRFKRIWSTNTAATGIVGHL